MTKRPRAPHHRSAIRLQPGDETLRLAVVAARNVIRSVKGVLNAAKIAGYETKISRSALEQFIRGATKGLKPENREMLADFLFRTPLGRAVRRPTTNAHSGYDRLMEVLSSGNYAKPTDLDVTGLYFLYHGSYLREERFAIHVLDIQCIDDSILLATDIIQDNLAATADVVLNALGCVTFYRDLPHLVLEANDNRVGLGLIVATDAWPVQGPMTTFIGTFSGITKGLLSFQRHCIAIRGTEDASETVSKEGRPLSTLSHNKMREVMVEQTGVFALEELKGRHRRAVDYLAKSLPERLSRDPLLLHPFLISRK